MANYSGMISTWATPLGAVRDINHDGRMTFMESTMILHGPRSSVRMGLNTGDYYFVKFERIPKERILNRFKNLGGNIKY